MSNAKQEDRTVKQLKARAKELGVDDDPRVTRANGNRPVKSDWVEVVHEAEEGRVPTQAEMVRRALVEGLSNEEIKARAEEHHNGMLAHRDPATCVSRTISIERQKASEWWMEHRDTICEDRPRVKYQTPEEEEES